MLGVKLLILLCIAFMADAQYRRPPPPRPNPGRPSRPAANQVVVEVDPNSIWSEQIPEIPSEDINTTPAPVMINAPANYPRPVPARPLPPNRPSYRPNRPLPSRPNRPGQPSQFAPIPNPSENNREPGTPGILVVYPEKNSTEEASSNPENSLPPVEEYIPEPTFPESQPEVIVPAIPNRPSNRPNRPLPSRPNQPGQPNQFAPIPNPSENNRVPETPGVVIVYPEKNSEEASSDLENSLPPSNPPTEEYIPEPTFPESQPEVIVPAIPNRPSNRPNRPLSSRPNRPGQPNQFAPIPNPSENNRVPETPGVVIVYPEKNSEEASSEPVNSMPTSNPPTEEYVPEPTFPDPQPEDYSEFFPNYFYPEEQPESGFEYEPVPDDEYEPMYLQPYQPNYIPELPETQPEYDPETQPEYEPETQPEYEPETQPEYEPETQPEYEPEPDPEPEQNPEFDPEGNPGFPEIYPEESFPASEPEEELELLPQPETEAEIFPETKPDSELFPEANLLSVTESIFDPRPNPYPTEPNDPLTMQPSYPEEPEFTTYFPLYDMDGDEPPIRENETVHETPYHPPTTEVYLPPITFTPRPIYPPRPINTPRPIYTPRTTPRLHTNPTTHSTPRHTPPPTPITSPSSITPEPVPPTLGPVNVIPLQPVMPVLPNRPSTSPLRPSSPIQSQPIIDFNCRDPDAYYSIANECDTFVQCKQGIARKYVCPDGLLFNPRAYWPQYPCVYPSQVRCNNKTIIQKPRPIGECPRRYGNFPARTGDCGQYVVCHDGHATLMNCPQGLAFNIRSGGCDWPEKVPSCKSNVFAGFQCPAPLRDDYGRISDRVDTFRYRASCKEYIACLKGEPRLLRCDPGLSFDEITGRCIDSDAVKNCESF